MMPTNLDTKKFGLYVHWPFCLAKCPYCDFNSHVRNTVDHTAWQSALLAEMRHWAQRTPSHRLHTIFFGGGTPSLMTPQTVGAVIDEAARLWPAANDVEITLEANPTSVEADKFKGFRTAGVNRVSLGIQALNDTDLKALGRQHSADEAKAAIKLAASSFDRYSFDLIYARPQQTVDAWQAELNEALDYAAEHLSVYQLTIEPSTGFQNLFDRGQLKIPDEQTAGALYEATQETLSARGLPAYEISNHARAGAECAHNLIYWEYDDYIGIGPGAHGRVQTNSQRLATATEKSPERWLAATQQQGHALLEQTPIDDASARTEALMMNLRLARGVNRRQWAEKFDADVLTQIDAGKLRLLVDGGFLSLDADTLAATAAGRQRLNAVLDKLLN